MMENGLIALNQLTPAQIRKFLPSIDGITKNVAEKYAKKVEESGHAENANDFTRYLKEQGVQNRYIPDIEALINFAPQLATDVALPTSLRQSNLTASAFLGFNEFLPLSLLTGPLPLVTGIDDLINRANDILSNPRQLITGPTSTAGPNGPAMVAKAVGERCVEPIEEHCPKKSALVLYKISNDDGDFAANIRVNWDYDCCNIYDASAELDITERTADDETVFMQETYSVAAIEPVKLKVCTPCQPKCLNAKLTIYHLESDRATFPSVKAIYHINLDLCANKKGIPKIIDRTTMIKAGDIKVIRANGPKNVVPEVVTGPK